jgi:hypothetical protein
MLSAPPETDGPGEPGQVVNPPHFLAREILLAASAQAVLATFREALERRKLTPHQAASLRVLESALIPYCDDDSPLVPQ